MTLTLDQIKAMVAAVEAFPTADINTLIANPDPVNLVDVLADVSTLLAGVYPQAEIAAIGFELVAFMLRNPAVNANTNQDPIGRGGRRW